MGKKMKGVFDTLNFLTARAYLDAMGTIGTLHQKGNGHNEMRVDHWTGLFMLAKVGRKQKSRHTTWKEVLQ